MNRQFIFCITIFILVSLSLYGQSNLELHANTYYHNLQYADAVPLYERVLKKNPKDHAAILNLADCYRQLNDAANAERVYRLLLNSNNASGEDHLRFAQALAQNGKYDEARVEYQQYLLSEKKDQRAENNIEAINHMDRLLANAKTVEVSRLLINSDYEDFAPAFYDKGIVFASARIRKAGIRRIFGWSNESFLDLYYSGDLSDPSQPLMSHLTRLQGSINSVYHEGPSVFFSSGDSVIFTRNNYANRLYRTDKLGVNRLKLYSAHRSADKWERIVELPINNNEYSVGHPALNPAQDTLYFASDMPGGFGETDIWIVPVNKGHYGTPVNAGPGINTEGREMFPYVDMSGNLLFASDGHGGLGGLDIFYAASINGKLQVPINAGAPINSPTDDFGLIASADGMTGYFSSYRNGKTSADDLFYFKATESIIRNYILKGTVTDRETHEVLPEAIVQLIDDSNIAVATVTATLEGAFIIPVMPDSHYQIRAIKENYFETSDSIVTKDLVPGRPIVHQMAMHKKGLYSLLLKVTDRKSNEPVPGAMVTISDKNTGRAIVTASTDIDGTIHSQLSEVRTGEKVNYTVNLERPGYLSKSVPLVYTFTVPGELAVHQVIDLSIDKIEIGADIGKLISVNPIYFDIGKSNVRPDAAHELDKIVAVMNENVGMRIELGSHTDARGSDAANLVLSDKRARASAAYIISQGISADRITGKGYGESRLVNKCGNGVKCTDVQHQMNRRTEFIIVSLGI